MLHALTNWHPNPNWHPEISGMSWGAKISDFGPLCIVNSCLKFSALWNTVEVYHLTENMRVLMSGSSEVQRYSEWLLKVTNCNMTLSSINMLRLLTEKLVKECWTSLRAWGWKKTPSTAWSAPSIPTLSSVTLTPSGSPTELSSHLRIRRYRKWTRKSWPAFLDLRLSWSPLTPLRRTHQSTHRSFSTA